MALSCEQVASVKGRGFLRNRGTDCFSGRVVSAGGVYSAADLETIAACASTYGNGDVIFTSRLSAEIVGIPFEKIEEAEAFLLARGLSFGGTGAKIRPIVACKGTTCVYGNIDTRDIAEALHERFYVGMRSVNLPHKFKIGVGGCPNSCMKPSLNDVGVEGHRYIAFDQALCRGCKACAVSTACPSHAVFMKDGKAYIEESRCLSCGNCIGKCPFGAFPKEAEAYCTVYVGGTWGKSKREGTPLSAKFRPDEIGDVVEKIMLWYRENGYAKEWLGHVVDRLGIGVLEAALATDDLIKRREEILAAPLLTQ